MTGWAALLGALGGVAIVFAILITLISLFQPFADLTWALANLVVGVVLLGSALAMSADSLKETLQSGEARRAGKYGTSAVVSTILGIAILGMLGFLGERYNKRFDWTAEGVHTLTDQSLQVLSGLERDVRATAFLREIEAGGLKALLERYAAASSRFSYEFADPNARPDLVETFEVDPESLSRGLVHLAMGEESVELTEVSEDKLTNALVSLTRTADKKIYFLTGHNERAIEGDDAVGKEGFKQAADALRNENYQVDTLLVAQLGEVPDDANAVVVAGPTRPLPPEEIAALQRYLDRGGAVLGLIDPRSNTNFDEVLDDWGVVVGNDIIVDLQLAFFQQYMSPFAGAYAAEHPITRKMGEQRNPTLFHLARSVEVREGAPGDLEPIVFTGDRSWAERDLARLVRDGKFQYEEDADLIGPVPVAVAGTLADGEEAAAGSEDAAGPGGRLVAIGDSDFASNEFILRYGGNRDLFVNSINWLLGDVEAISIRPHQSRASRFTGSEEDVRAIQYLSLFVLPESIAVLGVVAWWWRRKSPGR
ncbi:MAG: GldG family protein [Myxococcota bacterium]